MDASSGPVRDDGRVARRPGWCVALAVAARPRRRRVRRCVTATARPRASTSCRSRHRRRTPTTSCAASTTRGWRSSPGATWTLRRRPAPRRGLSSITVEDTTREVAGVRDHRRCAAPSRPATQVVDYYAQDRHGNVWWFGREGVWLAGEDGAEAGLAMPATPRVGDGWRAAYDADVVDVRMTVETRDHVETRRPGGTPTCWASTSATRSSPTPRGARSSSAGSGWSRRSRPPAPSTSPSCRARPLRQLERAHSGGRSWVVSVPGSGGGGC